MGNKLKFLTSNFVESEVLANYTYSSQNASYPAANILDPFRSKVWRTNGNFEVNWSNYQLIINTGSDLTINLTIAVYSTPTALATELQTQLNTVSSGFTVSYSSTTNKFKIERTSSFSILWTQSVDAARLFGFDEATDDTGRSDYTADERRICYPYEWLKFDYGLTRNPKGIVILDNLEENIKIQPSIEVILQGSPSDSWNSPEEISLTYNNLSITKINMSGLFSRSYRYNRLIIKDVDNPLGYIQIGKIYLGDVFELESSDVQRGLEEGSVDLSTSQRAIGGEVYADVKPSYDIFSNVLVEYCNKNDVDTIRYVYDIHKTYKPFIISIDSESTTTNNVNEWTKYVKFSSPPTYQPVTNTIWIVKFSIEEVL